MAKHDQVVFPTGRPCAEPGCITILNHFNPGPYCLCHTQKHEARLRALELADSATDERHLTLAAAA